MQRESIYDRMTNAEREVAQVLKELKIQWSYEQPVFVWDENKRPRVWTPDFYLVHLGIYIEVCGSEKFEYDYRKKIYNRNGYRVIFLHFYKDVYKWKTHLLRYLQVFMDLRNKKLNEIYLKKINCNERDN
jgi:hypothetical protein